MVTMNKVFICGLWLILGNLFPGVVAAGSLFDESWFVDCHVV